jgi:cell division protein FtsW
MGDKIMETKEKKKVKCKKFYDLNLVAVMLLLICFGLIMLYSASVYQAAAEEGDGMFYFKKQAVFSSVSLLLALGVSRIDYHIYIKFEKLIYLFAIILMVLVRTPLGVSVNGARRWLKIGGIQFQPSEFAKVAIILCLPCMVIHLGREITNKNGILKLLAYGGLLSAIIFVLTQNLSTAVIVAGITCGIIFVSHPKTKPFLIIAASVCVVVALLVFIIVSLDAAENGGFRIQRIRVWLHPEDFTSGKGFQVTQGLYAIGSGGLFGKGLGNSVQKTLLPEAQNDMIFSIVCEELGIFGAALVLILFAYLLYRLFFIAENARDLYGALVVTGIFIHVALQVILNVAVVVNMIPTTGVTLPFFSYGGTSTLFLMFEMGVALSVSRGIKFEIPQTEDEM